MKDKLTYMLTLGITGLYKITDYIKSSPLKT